MAGIATALVAAGLTTACPSAITPPGAPTVDVVQSPTSHAAVVLQGSAPHGTTVVVTRVAPTPLEITRSADPFTARWWATIDLETGTTNRFRIVAREDDRESAPTEVIIVHEPARAHGLALGLEPSVVDVDDGLLRASVQVSHPEAGLDLGGLAVELERTGALTSDVAQVTVTTDAAGRATHLFTRLSSLGPGSVTARAVDGGAEATAPYFVGIGDESEVIGMTLHLSSDGSEPTRHLTVPAATEIAAHVEVLRGDGLDPDPEALLSTDAPGARIEGWIVTDVIQAGSWWVKATHLDGIHVSAARLDVTPGPPVEIEVLLPTAVPVDVDVDVGFLLHDAHGNLAAGVPTLRVLDALGTSEVSASTAFVDGQQIRFLVPGDYTVEAALHVDAESDPVLGSALVTAGAGSLPDPDLAVVSSPGPGALVTNATGAIEVIVEATAAAGIAALALEVRGRIEADLTELVPGAPTDEAFAFTIPVDGEEGVVETRPTVTDRLGRSHTGPWRRFFLTESVPIVADGYAVAYVAGGPDSLLDRPKGVSRFRGGRILVASYADHHVVEIDPDTLAEQVLFQTGGTNPLHGVAWDETDGWIFVTGGPSLRVHRFTEDGSVGDQPWSSEIGGPRGIHFGEDGLMYVGSRNYDRVYVYSDRNADAQAVEAHQISCGEAPWGVVLEQAEPRRILYVTRDDRSRIYRCEDDGAGGAVTLEEIVTDAASWDAAGDLVRLGPHDLLVAAQGPGQLVRVFRTEDGLGGIYWHVRPVVEGLGRPVGLDWDPEGRRVLFTDEDRNLILVLEGDRLAVSPPPLDD